MRDIVKQYDPDGFGSNRAEKESRNGLRKIAFEQVLLIMHSHTDRETPDITIVV